MLDYDPLEEFRDPQTYDLECEAYDEDRPLVEQWARALGGPLLDLACGTGRMALRLAAQGYQVTGVDIVPEMIALARQKAAERSLRSAPPRGRLDAARRQAERSLRSAPPRVRLDAARRQAERIVSVEWVVADARSFHLEKQFPFIYMLGNAFQFFLTRADQEGLLARVREHLQPEGCFLFETRNPSPRNLYEVRHPEGETHTMPDGGQLLVTERQQYDPLTQIQHYTRYLTFVHAGGQRLEKTLRVALRYVFPQEMEALLFYNGLQVRACYGSWQQAPMTASSPAMIYVCEKRMGRAV